MLPYQRIVRRLPPADKAAEVDYQRGESRTCDHLVAKLQLERQQHDLAYGARDDLFLIPDRYDVGFPAFLANPVFMLDPVDVAEGVPLMCCPEFGDALIQVLKIAVYTKAQAQSPITRCKGMLAGKLTILPLPVKDNDQRFGSASSLIPVNSSTSRGRSRVPGGSQYPPGTEYYPICR